MAFTQMYKQEVASLQEAAKDADLLKQPAADYLWLPEQFPSPSHVPDLTAQVTEFLKLPAPQQAPKQTLWVFNFGTWDIWNLAALPLDQSSKMVKSVVGKMIGQMEVLNYKALDSRSVAYSDFWFNMTEQQAAGLAAPNAADNYDARRLESFRVVVPKLFDVSLTPGWRDRPAPPFPHTKGEQMRNAAMLTKLWNEQLREKLHEWEERASEKPSVGEDEKAQLEKIGGSPDRIPAKEPEKREVIYAPYPRRMAYQPSMADLVTDSMTEEEMQRAHVEDSKGHGAWPANDTMRFLDVWKPCLEGAAAAAGEPLQSDACDFHLFHDEFTVNPRAVHEITRKTARNIIKEMFRREKRKAKKKNS